jgi:hypothetical protein
MAEARYEAVPIGWVESGRPLHRSAPGNRQSAAMM